MYLAEIRGKLSAELERNEDILTSNVFSFFKYSNRCKYLMSLIQEIGIEVSNEDLRKAEFIFWPKFDDRTEPDLVIIIGKYYLLFEAKYFSDFSIDQIKREIEGGLLESKNLGKDFYYIAITSDYYYKNEKFKDIKLICQDHFKWINWQTLCFIIENNINGEDETDYYMASDLFQLMLKKNLRNFQGFENLTAFKHLSKIDNVFFDSTSTKYRGDFFHWGDQMNKQKMVEQTKLAIESMVSLYVELSYLIKEIEGLLKQEDEEFVIGKPAGYGITTKGSTSLDQAENWLLKKFSVFFVPEEFTKEGRNTVTEFKDGLKIIYLRFVLHDKNNTEPKIYIGVLKGLSTNTEEKKWPDKVEHIMGHIEYNENKILKDISNINYEDKNLTIKGKLIEINFFDITNSNDIVDKLIKPAMKIFRTE